ncbi:TPA: hypothetical protein ACK1AU_002589 [Staphylococcus aureus]|nr:MULTISPECIES: hypothetical protein [Staphylococcus]MDT0694206.1 hypothetical protein [Staphylococcus chromogenes]
MKRVDKLEEKEQKARIRESNSNTIKNYTIAISTLAALIKLIVGG